MKKVSFSPSRTPVKVYNPRPNDFCRVCRESIRISGRSQINLFGDKNQDFLRRFRGVAGKKIENIAGVSQVLCQKCYRTVLKYDKVLEQEKELLIFRENYKEEAVDFTDKLRKKRCAKDSPTCETTSEPQKKTSESARTHKRSKRKILSPTENSDIEDNPFQHFEDDVFLDPRDCRSRNPSLTEVGKVQQS